MPKNNNKMTLRISILKYTNICLGVILLFSMGSVKKQGNNIKDIGSSVSTVSTEQTTGYRYYYNQRFGFSLEYPNDFKRDEGSNDNNGSKFYSPDRNAILTVYGLNNTHRENPEVLYRTDLSVIKGTITYNVLQGNSYMISWTDNNNTFYRRVEAGLGCINVFMFQCPVSQTNMYNTTFDYINRSFKTGNLYEAY